MVLCEGNKKTPNPSGNKQPIQHRVIAKGNSNFLNLSGGTGLTSCITQK